MASLAVDTKTAMFNLFPELPIEIRLKIWKIVAHFPRDVQISAPFILCPDLDGHWDDEDESEERSKYMSRKPVALERFKSTTPVPTILQVNNEGRTEGLRFYTNAFTERQTSAGARVYINPAADTLLIRISDRCKNWYHWAKRRFVHVPETAETIKRSRFKNTPWSRFGLKAKVAMAHPQRIGCCAQREIVVVVKAHDELKEDVREHVAKMEFWGKVTETTEFTELMEWDYSWLRLFAEIDVARRRGWYGTED